MNGKLTINRITHTKGPTVIQLWLEDGTSHIRFLVAEITLEDFALVLTGRGQTDCTFELYDLKNIGKKLETKTEIVLLPFQATAEARKLAVEPFEVDGWKARESDIENHHNFNKNTVKVVFSRFVE